MQLKVNELTIDLFSETSQDEAWLQRFIESSRQNTKLLIWPKGGAGFGVISVNSDISTLKAVRFLPMNRRGIHVEGLNEDLQTQDAFVGKAIPPAKMPTIG